jgi:DNA repair exonuclease SbcCD ATPase subunit/DNA repair exonuclease SbcCD nuclease subunit
MKLASIGDIHAGQHNLKDTKIGMKQLVNVLDIEATDVLIITGDIFHEFNIGGKNETFGSVFNSVLTPLMDFLSGGERRKIIMLPGNHDMATDKESLDALTSFEYRDRIYVSKGIGAFKVANNIMVTTLPWMYTSRYTDKKHILKSLQEIRNNSKDYINILAGHCEIDGSEILSGYTMFGGHFNFTKEDIDDLGFDIVTLGHVHKTQGHYTGSPWQHNFGDENHVGCVRIMEIGETITRDELVEIPNTPKYYNIKLDDVDNYIKRDIDHVKVIGTSLNRDLPLGYKFEKEKFKTEVKQRTNVSCSDSIRVLLGKWLKEKGYYNTSVPELVDILDEVKIPASYNTSFGSLDRFESVKIQGIGSHKDTSMEFIEPLVAISGGNGVGKTMFMESLFASLYGEMPSYGKLANLSDKKCLLESVFHTNKDKYKVIRKINNGKNSAWIYKDGSSKPIVGPKVSEVNAKITQLVGPKELLLSSVFSTQVHAGDIVELDPSKRKGIFHQILGLGIYADMKEKINDKFKEAKTQREMLLSQLKTVKTLDEVEKEVVTKSTLMTEANIRLSNHEGAIVNYVIKKEAKEKEYSDADKKMTIKAGLEHTLQGHRDNLISTQHLIKFAIPVNVDALIDKCSNKKKDLRNEAEAYNKQNDAILAVMGKTIAYNKVKTEYDDCVKGRERFEELHALEIKTHVEKSNLINDAGCKDSPIACPFIEGAVESISMIEKLDIRHIAELKLWDKKIANLLTKKDEAWCAIDDSDIGKIDKSLYKSIEADIKKLEMDIGEGIDHNRSIIKLKEDEEYYYSKILEIKIELESMKDDSALLILLKNQIQCIDDSLGKERALATAETVKVAEIKKDVEHLGYELDKLTTYNEQIKNLDNKIPKLEILNEALSINGIPQLIIDSALPQLQDILDILAEFINKFKITIKTQKLNKTGDNAKETIDFIVDDGIKSRDVKFFSGGEKKLLKTLIRLSLSLFQSQRTGNSYKLLLMDETFDALDIENSLLLLKIIYNLRSKFKQIFVISHSDDVLGRLSKCIKFKREGNRTLIDG